MAKDAIRIPLTDEEILKQQRENREDRLREEREARGIKDLYGTIGDLDELFDDERDSDLDGPDK